MKHSAKQSDTTFNEISQLIWNYLEARDWHKLEARSLAVSISLEANELLEHYQWQNEPIGDKQELAMELADILIYAFEFAQQTDIDMAQAIRDKLQKTALKYPAETFKGKAGAERREAWIEAKTNYKKEGL